MKKVYIVFMLLFSLSLFGCGKEYYGVLELELKDDSIPSSTYNIKLDFDKGSLYTKLVRNCSTIECNNNASEKNITITHEEMQKVWNITKRDDYEDKKSYLIKALQNLSEDSKVMANKKDYEDYWNDIYLENDLNSDSVVTYREFANHWLDVLLKDNK
ncbi:MAG: hypothetical protein IJ572_02530 [Bacilli bacterium]|nr:hypothetical protein [Bacilli bacterium]